MPLRFSALSGLVPARSVSCSRRTLNCSGVSSRLPFLGGFLDLEGLGLFGLHVVILEPAPARQGCEPSGEDGE